MTRPEMHWPGAVGMFLDTPTPYFAVRTYRAGQPIGWWNGWAQSLDDAEGKARKVFANMVQGNRCPPDALDAFKGTQLTSGQIAAHITGAEMRDLVRL